MQPRILDTVTGGRKRLLSNRKMQTPGFETPSVQSLDRGLFILETVARASGPVPLGELTELLGVDRSSAFRLANTLRRRGFLANPNARKDYILGPSIWRLSRQCDWSKVLITLGREQLKKLAIETGETTHLAVREGRQTLFLDHYGSTNQILVVPGQTGEFAPLYCTAHGKALLADFDLAGLRKLFGSEPLEKRTPRTIVSLSQLAEECARIKAEGYAFDDAEMVREIKCMAAPIRDRDGSIVGCIGISAPMLRFRKDRRPIAARQVKTAAEQISALLRAETEDE